MSGANSYVNVFKTLEEAKNEMYDSIRVHIAHCEQNTMDEMIQQIDEMMDGEQEIEIDGFKCIISKKHYSIRDKFEEDQYHFIILDTDLGEYSNKF